MLPERYRTCKGNIRAAKGLKGKEMEEGAKSVPLLSAAPTALEFFLPISPALPGWANLYRAYGAFRN
jgi:hypothetical protein